MRFGTCVGSRFTVQSLVAMAAVGVATLSSPGAISAAILFDNLSAGSPNGYFGVTNGQWAAQAFSTSSTAFTISDVTLNMFNQNATTGGYELQIWTATGASGSPGSQVGSAIYTGLAENLGSGPLTINGLSVALAPSTSYYLVTRGVSLTNVSGFEEPLPGYLAWNATDVNTSASFSTVDGVSWSGPFSQNLYMKVEAVPEPSTCAMALAGLACGCYSIFRRRKQA